MRTEETLWLLTGVNLMLNDFTSPGSRRRLYTKGLVDPSTKPEVLLIRDVCQQRKCLLGTNNFHMLPRPHTRGL